MVKRSYRKKVYNKKKRALKIIAVFGFILLGIFISGAALFVYYTKDLPRPEKFTEGLISQPTEIYDRSGKILLYEIVGKERRKIVSFDKIPEHLKKAVITAEDRNFYQHKGIDIEAVLRAIVTDLRSGKPSQGGSTISQQLIRCYFLTRNKTFKRKTREIVLTLELERRYSKDQILGWYLNIIPFGSNLYGVEAASQAFFGKDVSQISLSEAATLAALIRSPSYLWPYGQHKKELLARRDYILEGMMEQGYITKKQRDEAVSENIVFLPQTVKIKAPHFVMFVKKFLEQKYGNEYLTTAGLKVITTLDANMQNAAEKIIEEKTKNFKIYNAHNAALVAINPDTGEIEAMVGSKDWYGSSEECNKKTGKCMFDPKVNAALSLRQPGSAFKPFVYAAAFNKGFTPQTLVWDVKTEFNPSCPAKAMSIYGEYKTKCYHPKNYDGRFSGIISLKESLAQSRNVPSVKVLYLAGLDNVLDLVQKFGITTLTDRKRYGLSLVLGGGEVKLLEMVQAYSVFANNGLKPKLKFIKEIRDAENNIIEKEGSPQSDNLRVLSSNVAQEINDILSDNKARAPTFGQSSLLNIKDYDVAVKTGTTQNYKDAWTIGYTKSIVCGVWVGNNDSSPMTKPGVSLAGPIWNNFMRAILPTLPKNSFEKIEPKKTGKDVLDGIMNEKHCILYFINKENPRGNGNSRQDIQFKNWENAVLNFINNE